MAKSNMSPQERELVLTMARAGVCDFDIMAKIGRSLSAVKSVRLRAGIVLGTRADAVNPTPEQIEELGITSDRGMSRKYGHSHKTWSYIRRKHGIPRFRAPTVGKDAPPPKAKARALPRKEQGRAYQSTFTIQAPREYSPATEAQRYLQSQGWMVVNRAKVYGAEGWNVGRMVLSEEAMLEMASRKGFQFAGYL